MCYFFIIKNLILYIIEKYNLLVFAKTKITSLIRLETKFFHQKIKQLS